MLIIEQPYIEEKENKSRLFCSVSVNEKKKVVWFEVEKKYGHYLCFERADAYLIGLLNWAMRNGHDIISHAPISSDLLYNITNYLIPSLTKYDTRLYPSQITCPIIETPIINDGGVGSGLSCGIDSFHVIAKQLSSKHKDLRLTHLCINNVGAFNGCYSNYGIAKAKEKCYERALEVAKELGIPLIISDSNFQSAFLQNHLLSHTYSSMFAVFCMQKLWSTFFYGSSGYDFSEFTLINNSIKSSDHYELLSLNCFSTKSLRIYNEGAAQNRLEKTIDIANMPIAQKYLHVCTREGSNCGKCPKCKRTILSLYALGVLDSFKMCFNLQYFNKNKDDYLVWLYQNHLEKDKMNEPTYISLKKEITLKIKLKAYLSQIIAYLRKKKYFYITNKSNKTSVVHIFFIKISFKHKMRGKSC